jgi:alpha-tubulin suppressor-like RCC1 family protein
MSEPAQLDRRHGEPAGPCAGLRLKTQSGVRDLSHRSVPAIACGLAVSLLAGCAATSSGGPRGNGADGSTQTGGDGGAPATAHKAVSIAASNAVCAIVEGGQVWCWGLSDGDSLGEGTPSRGIQINDTEWAYPTPVPVAGLTDAVAVAVGPEHECALRSDGTVACWGLISLQVTTGGLPVVPATPVTVSGLTGATAITAGSLFNCALLANGTVECWGEDSSGNLGSFSPSDAGASFSPPVVVPGLQGVTAIASGAVHTCALLSTGTVSCWGDDFDLELGSDLSDAGTFPSSCGGHPCSATPIAVPGLSGVTAIAAGGTDTCALRTDGSVQCWGMSGGGGLGNGQALAGASLPVDVQGLPGPVRAISVGEDSACALLSAGTVECWGLDRLNLPYASNPGTPEPVVADWSEAVALPDGGFDVPTSDLSDVQSVAAGSGFACAVLTGGAVECWGKNDQGQLGTGQIGLPQGCVDRNPAALCTALPHRTEL